MGLADLRKISFLAVSFVSRRLGLAAIVLGLGQVTSFSLASAAVEVDFQPVGRHFPIFVVEKSENPENTLIAYTKLDADCRIQSEAGKPMLDYYWLMDRSRYKPVHPLIKGGIRSRLEVDAAGFKSHAFMMRMNDLKELRHDLGAAGLKVETEMQNGACVVQAFIRLGPSEQNRTLRLESIYTESKKTIVPPFRKVVAVTLKGHDVATEQRISHRYVAR